LGRENGNSGREAIVVDPEAASLAESFNVLRSSMKGLDYTLIETCDMVIAQLVGSTNRDGFASEVNTIGSYTTPIASR
jgi:hypothetical protein